MSETRTFKDHFSSVAASYAEFRPEYPVELFRWIASISTARERVWDCATGNGQAAVALAEHFQEVVATDASAGQIENARPRERVRYSVAPAECSRLTESYIDVITVAQAAHWFDLPKFYREARRVLKPDGCLMIWCYGTFRFGNETIDRLLDDFYHQVVGPFWPPERRWIEEDYRTIEFPLTEIVPPAFHMQGSFTPARLAGYLRTWSATQRFHREKGFDPVITLEKELARLWVQTGASTDAKSPVSWPISIRAGRFL